MMPQQHTWDDLRVEIQKTVTEKGIPASDFRPLDIYEGWEKIEEKIYDAFCHFNHHAGKPIWLWEHFKLDTASLEIKHPFNYLDQLIDPSQEIWFFVNGDKDKFWFYQGKVRAIQTVIDESSYIDELYLASRKYDWLICINHHDCLIATGDLMPDRVRKLVVPDL
jgi:hypothetical protein